jgi:hypothetical protein
MANPNSPAQHGFQLTLGPTVLGCESLSLRAALRFFIPAWFPIQRSEPLCTHAPRFSHASPIPMRSAASSFRLAIRRSQGSAANRFPKERARQPLLRGSLNKRLDFGSIIPGVAPSPSAYRPAQANSSQLAHEVKSFLLFATSHDFGVSLTLRLWATLPARNSVRHLGHRHRCI